MHMLWWWTCGGWLHSVLFALPHCAVLGLTYSLYHNCRIRDLNDEINALVQETVLCWD
jgi:hypothetical protein